MAERPLYTLYKNLKAQNYDVPNDYNKFESALTRDGKSGADNRHAIYENLKAQNFDVPDTYERFYTALFEPRSKTSSRAKGGSVPMSAADRARFSAGAAAISASAKQMANNAGRYNRLNQRKQKQQKDFGRVNLGTHLTPFGGDANDVVKDEFAYNPETGKAGAYVTSDNENAYTQSDAEQKQAILDKYGEEWNKAVDMGMVPSELDKADPDMSDTDVAMRQMERRQEWLDENQNRRSKELNESMHLQDSPFVASGGAVAPSSFNAAIGNEANRLSDAEYGAYNTAKAYNQMLRTTLLQELKEQKQRNEDAGWWKDKWNDVSNYFGGMLDTMLDPKLYSQGVMDAAIASNLLQVKKGMEDGTIKKGSNAGEAAQVMLSAIQQQQGEAAKQQQNGAKAYQYGDVSGRSLKFMGDFALSGWRDVMTTGFTKAGEKVGEKMALGTLGKWFTKNTGRVLGDMAGSAALAATNQLGSTYNNVIERYVGMNNENGGVTQDKDGDLKFNEGVSLGKAIKDGFGSATIENFSEMFGEYLPGASKILSKLGLSKVSSFFEKIGNNAYYKWLSNATNKSGIQGVMSEIAEEEFGTALHAAWGDGDGSWSDFNVFTNPDAREKQIDTCLGMFYSVGFTQSPRTAVGAINAVKYFHIKLQVTKADKFGQMMFNDKWDDIKSKIDVTTNADLTKTVLDATRSDSMTAKQKGAVINYAMFLSKLRGFNQASDAKTKDKVEEGETVPTLSNYLDDAYTEGHNADDADKHDIQIKHEDQAKTLAAALNISEQQLSGMSDEELESLTGQDDKLDQAIYDYQLSSARYQGVVDDAQDKVDLAAHQAEQRVDMYTDQSRGSVRNATIKASGGAEDYGVYIISGNIATRDDGSIDVSNSDDMILYFDPTTNSVEHADALMFAELGEELPAVDVKAQAVADAKENAIKEVAGIIDGTVEVGSQFNLTDADGTEHTYEVLADNGDGTAMITIDGNVPTELVKGENVQIPYSFEELQQMKDLEDQKRLEAAKAEREQMEKERDGQETEQTEDSQPSFDFNQILNDNGNVVLVDVLGQDGNTKYPGSTLFLIRDAGAKAKVVELKSDGTIVPHAVNKEDVATISSMSLDEYKQAMPSSMIEDNSGENRGEIEEEAPTIEGETAEPAEEADAPESTETTATEQTPNAEQTPATPAITLEDGTIVPMLEDGNPDFSKLSAAQTAELYDSQFGEDADGIVSGYVSDAKKALDKANNMTVKGKTFVEQKAAKDAKEKAIADAQAAYDSAVAIRDAYSERQLAKEENTPEGRKSLIEKARRKYARLKNSEEWSERTGDLWNETVGKLLHRLYDATGIDVFDDTPNTVYEYVASNVGPYSLNYEGNDNSKGVQQETGLSRSDFAKLGWLAAEGKGMTIDAKVHRLWENRPSNLESADTQEIRNALISLITSGQTAFQARDYILDQRIELAESALEEQLRQEEDAAEARRAKEEEEEKKKVEEENTNENRNTPELSHEQQKAMEEGEKLGFPAVDKEGEPINQNVIELANWAKEQGLEIDPTSKLNSYADLFVMCKDGFGVSTLVPDVGENINQVFYFPDNVQGEQLLKLQEEFNVGRDLKHSADMNSELTEGAMFYDGDTAREFKEFVDKNVEMQNKVFGEQRPEEDLPFSAKENGQQQTTAERAADVEKNKVDDMKVVDNIVGQKTRKVLEKLAKMMGANVQWQYSDKNANGWFDDKTNTIYLTLDSSITESVQFIFGHEMTHEMRTKNPAAYDELKTLVKDMMGEDAFNSETDRITSLYNENNVFYNGGRTAYEEEVVADQLGKWIRDANYAHTLLLKMSHPLLARLHEIVNRFLMALHGIEFSDDMRLILRSIEQAYVKTANGQVTNSETGEDVSFSLRLKSAIEDTETNPSDAQKESGNYKKGHIKFGGYDYTIENPKGSVRSGKDANGKEWKVTMHDTYGYIRGKYGKDGDHLDMFINDKADLDNWDGDVFVVDQVNPDGSFDEHKVMYGYDSMDDAEKAYLANYSKGWQGLGNITGASKTEFDKWLDMSNRKLKPFKDYVKVKFSLKDNQGNPLNQDGTLKLDKIKSVDELTDEDFTSAFRNVELPSIPKNVDAAIGANGKPVIIKKNIFEKNWNAHKFTPAESKKVLNDALYNTDLVGHTQPTKKPNHWVAIKLDDKSPITVLEVSDNKDNIEVVGWYTLDERNLGRIKRQAERNGGELIMLTPKDDKVESLSTPPLSSAAKIDNSSETSKENGEKFSLKDEKTLAGVHNITEEKLRKALKLGGFANPSLAVIDTSKSGHDNFGEISFIAPSVLLDKRTGKTGGTWITDAYTQRYPSVERQMSEKGYRKFEDWVDSLDYPSGAKAEIKRQTKDVLEDNGVPAWELMYLKEKGIDIKAYDSNVDYRWKEIISDHPTAEDILNSMKTDPELNEKVTSLAKHVIIYPTWGKVSLEVRRKIYKETGVKKSPISPIVRQQTKEIFERDYKSTLLNKDGSPRKKDVKKVVEDIVKEHNDTKKYDFYLSKVKASNYVNKNGLYDDYIRWQEKKLDEFGTKNRIFRGYKPDGTRKYVPETLENVSKAMREEAGGQTNGSEYTSFGSFIAKLASRVDSTDEMRANKDKLSSNEDKEEFYEKWSEVYYDLAKYLYNDVFYGEQRLHDIVLQSDPKKYAKKEYGITLSPTFIKKLDALKNAVQAELKSAYFETKYNRPLRLNEFAAAVVPDNLGEDVRKGIEDAGLPMYDYDPKKEGDRNRAFSEAINSSDNIRFSLKEEKEKIVADAKANGTYMTAPNGEKTKLDAEQWATVRTTNFKNWFGDWENDPENASKVVDENGEPMVMYHYTDENFTIFGKDKEVGKNTFGNATNASYAATTTVGHWFTSNKQQPEYMGKPMECFLNIVEPFDGYTLEGLADYLNNYMSEEDFNYYEEDYENVAPIIEAGNNFREEKIKDGYDGVVIDDEEFGGTSYVAFNANQIKSAENNNGDFSADNNDIRFSLRYDKFEHDLNQWKKDNNLPKDAKRPTIPQRNVGESAVDFLRRVDEYRKQMALWKTAPTYEQHLLSDDTALGEFNRELQRGSVLKRIAFQDSMLAIRKAQEAIMKEVGVDRLNMAEDAYTAENRSHGKGKNEFEEYNNEFLQPLRKAYHQMKKVLGDSYDNVRLYMMAKHGLERNAQMAFKESLEADYEDVAQRSAAYKAYKGDINRMGNDSGFELGYIDYATWVREDNAIKMKYSPSYMKYRYDKMGIAFDYSGLSALFDGSDFEEAAHKLVRDIESKHIVETKELWDATNAATKKILRDGYKAGMMSKDTYQYVRDMYSHYIPLRGWDGTTADQVWDYIGSGKGAFNQTLKKAHGRTSIADDPIAYIENMAESGILLNNKNWVKQHLMLLAQNHPTSLLTLSKAWYVKSTDANGNEEWVPATPQITSQMNSNQVKAAIDAFEQKMEQMEQTGDATQKRDGLNIAYPQTHSEEREHEVRVMKDGEEYVIYVNGDPQLAQAMNNTRAHRVREIQSGKLDRAAAWLGRKMAAAYTSLSPLFIPSNYFRDLTMTLASTAIREDGRYNYLLRKNLATSWNLGFMLRDYQNGKLREKVSNGNATPKEQMFYDFMMNGGETGFVSSIDVEDLKKKFKNDLKDFDRWKANPVKVGHTIMDSIEFLNRMIEDSNRFAIYMTSIQYGRSIDEAVNDAKDVTLNFNRKGTGEYGWQMIRNLYLFINPAVQSLQTLGALAKHHPFEFTAVTASWLASGVLVPIVNAALMSLFGGDDDKDKYWQFTKWDRRNNLIMWVPFTHEYVKIPLAQEFRAFYGVGDMIASKMMGGELAEESWSQYAEDLLGQVVDMLPLDPTGYDGNIAVSLMPNAIRPIFELAFNVDFTGKPLFKDTEYNKYDPNFTKAYVGTPDWLVRVSKMVNSIGNDYPDVQQNSIDAFGDPRYNLNNPGVVDHVLSSYLGGAYTMGSQVLGLLTKSLNDPKEIKMADIPLFSKFVSNPDDRPVTKKQGDEFWDMKENHDRAANTLSKLKKQAKVDGDYSMLERFYGSEEYKQYKQDDVKVKKYEEDKKKERAEESGEEYRPHKLNAEDIYKAHTTPMDDFEDLKLKQLYTKLNGFKSTYDLLVDTAPSQSDGYYNTNKSAIDAIDEITLDKQEISELKKGFLDDGKDAYNAEDMKRIRKLRKKVLAVLEKANKVVVANQKAKAKKK